MAIYYSPSAAAFFFDGIQATVPDDAFRVSDAQHTELLLAQGEAKVIVYDPATRTLSAQAPAAPPPTLQSAMLALQLELSRREAMGVYFQPAGQSAPVLFPTDRDSQVKIAAAFSMASAGLWRDGASWIAADGGTVPMTRADVLELAGLAADYISRCTDRFGALATALKSDVTTDITKGWPSNGAPPAGGGGGITPGGTAAGTMALTGTAALGLGHSETASGSADIGGSATPGISGPAPGP